MNPRIIRNTLLLAAMAFSLSGCVHLSPGSATEFKSKMGVAPLFSVENDFKGIRVTEKTAKAEDATVKVQILNFEWVTTGKGVVLPNPKG